jgi:hypothetical protein
MTRKGVLSLAAVTIGAGLLAVGTASAFGFGHHGHHGSGAARACLAVMPKDQRPQLKSIFTKYGPTLKADRKAVFEAKQAVEQGILTKSSDLATLEGNLATAKTNLQHEEDLVAGDICGLLNMTQLGAADNLYNELVALRENTHKQAREDVQKARESVGLPVWGSRSTQQGE